MKKAKYFIGLIIIGAMVYYLFVKPSDYIVRFEAKTSPGTIYKGVEDWSLVNKTKDSFNFEIIEKAPFEFIKEKVEIKGMDLQLEWYFEAINDSLSRVKVKILEKDNSIYNRLSAPLFNTPFKKTSVGLIQDFKSGMDLQLKNNFKIKIIGRDTIPEISYAYIEVKNITLSSKAKEMMMNNAALLNFVNEHNIKNGDFPFLIIDNWDIINDLIDFRYCFPIVENDSLPFHENIKYDKILSTPALKAIYNGNYKTSDRGWFGLYDYALRNDIKTLNHPIEFFYNNPYYGGDELKWVAEVYMPIKSN
jgi:effector-binding domain-containing protein